jgi:hypothetical protein
VAVRGSTGSAQLDSYRWNDDGTVRAAASSVLMDDSPRFSSKDRVERGPIARRRRMSGGVTAARASDMVAAREALARAKMAPPRRSRRSCWPRARPKSEPPDGPLLAEWHMRDNAQRAIRREDAEQFHDAAVGESVVERTARLTTSMRRSERVRAEQRRSLPGRRPRSGRRRGSFPMGSLRAGSG